MPVGWISRFRTTSVLKESNTGGDSPDYRHVAIKAAKYVRATRIEFRAPLLDAASLMPLNGWPGHGASATKQLPAETAHSHI
jgi:hypothetical protein